MFSERKQVLVIITSVKLSPEKQMFLDRNKNWEIPHRCLLADLMTQNLIRLLKFTLLFLFTWDLNKISLNFNTEHRIQALQE